MVFSRDFVWFPLIFSTSDPNEFLWLSDIFSFSSSKDISFSSLILSLESPRFISLLSSIVSLSEDNPDTVPSCNPSPVIGKSSGFSGRSGFLSFLIPSLEFSREFTLFLSEISSLLLSKSTCSPQEISILDSSRFLSFPGFIFSFESSREFTLSSPSRLILELSRCSGLLFCIFNLPSTNLSTWERTPLTSTRLESKSTLGILGPVLSLGKTKLSSEISVCSSCVSFIDLRNLFSALTSSGLVYLSVPGMKLC